MPSTATTIEDNTTEQAEAAAEDSTTDHVPHYPWFSQHVQTSLIKRSFTPLYFTVGLVEEMAELEAELSSWRRHQHNRDEAGSGVDIFKGFPVAVRALKMILPTLKLRETRLILAIF